MGGGGRVWGENQNEKYPNLTLMQGIIHVCYVPAHTCKYMQIKLQGKKDGKSKTPDFDTNLPLDLYGLVL